MWLGRFKWDIPIGVGLMLCEYMVAVHWRPVRQYRECVPDGASIALGCDLMCM